MFPSRNDLLFKFAILILIQFFASAITALGQSPYTFTVVAKTDGGQFLSLDPSVSINDNGSVAFLGQYNRDGRRRENLFIFDGATGNTRKLLIDGLELETPAPSPSDFGQLLNPGVQINNQNIAIVRRRMNARVDVGGVRSVAPFTYIEGWGNGNLPLQFAMGDAEVGPAASLLFFLNPSTGAVFPSPFVPNSPFGLLYQWASINNKGQAVFSAGKLVAGRIDRYLVTPVTPPYIYNRVLVQGDSSTPLPRPVIADNSTIITRFPGQSGDELRLFSHDLSSFTVIAGPQNGFTNIGRSPSISDDGKIIAFTAIAGKGAPVPPGLAVCVALKADEGWKIYRAAGISDDSSLDPGEKFLDTNENGVFDNGEKDIGPITSLFLDGRVSVGNSGAIVYKAGAGDGKNGVFSSLIDIDDSKSSWRVYDDLSYPLVNILSPVAIAKAGDTLPGLTSAIQDSAVVESLTPDLDPANNTASATVTVSTSSEIVSSTCIQDELTGDTIQVNTVTGKYKVIHCGSDGFTLLGEGRINRVGCEVTLNGLYVTAIINACPFGGVKSGEATIKRTPLGPTFILKDKNIADSSCSCR